MRTLDELVARERVTVQPGRGLSTPTQHHAHAIPATRTTTGLGRNSLSKSCSGGASTESTIRMVPLNTPTAL